MSHQDTFNLWKKTPGGSKKTLFSIPKSIAMLFCGAAEPIQRLFGFPAVFSRESILAAYSNYRFIATKAEQELGMNFRRLEQAWLDTLEGERALLK